MERGIRSAGVASIWDPIAVQFCFAAGKSTRIPLRFAAKSGPGLGEPINANVTVVGLSEKGSMQFGSSVARLRRCAAIRFDGEVDAVLCENRVQVYTPDIFTYVGINPALMRLLVVKSTNHFRVV